MRPLGLQDLFWEEKGIGLPWASMRSSQLTCVALLLAVGRKQRLEPRAPPRRGHIQATQNNDTLAIKQSQGPLVLPQGL